MELNYKELDAIDCMSLSIQERLKGPLAFVMQEIYMATQKGFFRLEVPQSHLEEDDVHALRAKRFEVEPNETSQSWIISW